MTEKYFIPFVFFLVAAMLITPANAIGAYIPVGDPEIIHTSFVDVVSGEEEATLDIVIRNNAEIRASFDIRILDPCPCGLRGNYHRFTFNASEESVVPLRIGCANVDETGTCQIKVVDVNSPANFDIGYFNYKVKRAKECEDYGKFFPAGDNCIKKCTSEGYWEVVKCCGDKTVTWEPSDTTYGGWVCKDTSTPIKWSDGVVIVFGVIVMMVLYRRFKQRKVT